MNLYNIRVYLHEQCSVEDALALINYRKQRKLSTYHCDAIIRDAKGVWDEDMGRYDLMISVVKDQWISALTEDISFDVLGNMAQRLRDKTLILTK